MKYMKYEYCKRGIYHVTSYCFFRRLDLDRMEASTTYGSAVSLLVGFISSSLPKVL